MKAALFACALAPVGVLVVTRAEAQDALALATPGCPAEVRDVLTRSARARHALEGLSLVVRCGPDGTRITVRAAAARECWRRIETPGRAAPSPYDLLEEPFIPAVARAARSGAATPPVRCTSTAAPTRDASVIETADASAANVDALDVGATFDVSAAEGTMLDDAGVDATAVHDPGVAVTGDVTENPRVVVTDVAVAPGRATGLHVSLYARGTSLPATGTNLFGVGFDIGWQLPFLRHRLGVRVGGAFEYGEASFDPLGTVQHPSPSGFVALNALFPVGPFRLNVSLGARGGYAWLLPSPTTLAESRGPLDGFWVGLLSRVDVAVRLRSIVSAMVFLEAGFIPDGASVTGAVFDRPLYSPPDAPCQAPCPRVGWSDLWIAYGLGITLVP